MSPRSVSFTEEMKGFVTFGATDYDTGYRNGRDAGTSLMFHLTITADDIDVFLADPDRLARAEGWVESEALGGRREISQGDFNLFVDSGQPHRRFMRYRLCFIDAKDQPVTLLGFKDIGDDPGFDMWRDTTTLYTTVAAGHVNREDTYETLAMGIITIHVADFAKQLTTFRGDPKAVAQFGKEFVGKLWDVYGPHGSDGNGS